jgi:putative tryptophan/tyrosine transport system substrate-binding protein
MPIQALVRATSTIPIVGIDLESDPIANGWAKSIARPGGNLTGFFLDLPELGGKQIELLKEAVPTLSRLALLWDSTVGLTQFRATEAAARTAGVVPLSLQVRRQEDFRGAFDRAMGASATAIIHQATRTIPVVFVQVSDPVGSGFVAGLARPGGNVTGFTLLEAHGRIQRGC